MKKRSALVNKTKGEFDEDINVILRCRSSSIKSNASISSGFGFKDRWSCLDILPDKKTIRLLSPALREEKKEFKFDHVFDSFCYQEEVYEPIKNMIADAILGYNATIIAYGPIG